MSADRRRRAHQQRRILFTLGAMALAALVGFGLLLLAAPRFLPPAPTPTPAPDVFTPTPTTVPSRLTFYDNLFTPVVAQGERFEISLSTLPETRCILTVSVFSFRLGRVQNYEIANYYTDASGLCTGSLPVTTDNRLGSGEVRIQLNNAGRTRDVTWTFDIVPPPE